MCTALAVYEPVVHCQSEPIWQRHRWMGHQSELFPVLIADNAVVLLWLKQHFSLGQENHAQPRTAFTCSVGGLWTECAACCMRGCASCISLDYKVMHLIVNTLSIQSSSPLLSSPYTSCMVVESIIVKPRKANCATTASIVLSHTRILVRWLTMIVDAGGSGSC